MHTIRNREAISTRKSFFRLKDAGRSKGNSCAEVIRKHYRFSSLSSYVCLIMFQNVVMWQSEVKQSRYTPWRRLGGEVYSSYSFTTSALGGGWVVSFTPRPRFTSGEKIPSTHCTGGWMGPRACLDTEDRGKILRPCRGSNLDRPVVQPVVRHYTAWANPAPGYVVQAYNLCKMTETERVSKYGAVNTCTCDRRRAWKREILHNEKLLICRNTLYQILLGMSNKEREMNRTCNTRERLKTLTEF
jgi:hypothetical protein